MGVVTVWEVECKKGPGRSSWCVLHTLAGAFLGEIPLFPWNTSVASCLGQMVDAVCSFLNGTGFAQTSCAVQTLPSISAFLPSNFLLILWPHPSVCSWNLCFLVPNFTLPYFSGLAYYRSWSTVTIHEGFAELLDEMALMFSLMCLIVWRPQAPPDSLVCIYSCPVDHTKCIPYLGLMPFLFVCFVFLLFTACAWK